MQTITLETSYGPQQIKAVVLSNLCVHRSLSYPDQWDITHTASSLRVGWAFKRRKDAVEAAQAVDTTISWADALNAFHKGHVGALGAIRGRLRDTLAGIGFRDYHC